MAKILIHAPLSHPRLAGAHLHASTPTLLLAFTSISAIPHILIPPLQRSLRSTLNPLPPTYRPLSTQNPSSSTPTTASLAFALTLPTLPLHLTLTNPLNLGQTPHTRLRDMLPPIIGTGLAEWFAGIRVEGDERAGCP